MGLEIRGCLNILAVAVLVAGAFYGQVILIPLCFAALLFFIFAPTVRTLTQWKIPRTLSAALIVLGLFSVLSALVYQLSGPADRWVSEVPERVQHFQQKLGFIRKPIQKISNAGERVKKLTEPVKSEKGVAVAEGDGNFLYAVFDFTSHFFLQFLTVFTLLYLFLAYGPDLLKTIAHYFGIAGYKARFVKKLEMQLSLYFSQVTLINIGLGFTLGMVFWATGLPNPTLWGAMAIVLNYVPYIGALVGVCVVFFVSVVTFSSPLDISLPPLLYLIVSGLEGQILTPMVLGFRMSVNPILILVTTMVLAHLWGIPGAFLAVPLLVVGKLVLLSRMEPSESTKLPSESLTQGTQ